MALIYEAELSPTKRELLGRWVPTRPWSGGDAVDEVLGSFRFDDPDGEVGIETHLVRAGGRVLQVPVTYRGAPLPGAEDRLITTMEHSVLGRRWVHDAVADPVYVRELLRTVLGGGHEAVEWVHRDGGEPDRAENPVRVAGSGDGSGTVPDLDRAEPVEVGDDDRSSVVRVGPLRVAVARAVATSEGDGGPGPVDAEQLSGTWPGQGTGAVLAAVLGRPAPG